MKSRPSFALVGFTLIELLVVIVIIAVLAGLLFPVYVKVRKNAVETRTVSNLRQIGTAISSYCSEHDDTLPGPLSVEQYPVFGDDPKKDEGSLAQRLAPYLSLSKKEKDGSNQRKGEFDIFECPGATGFYTDDIPGYIMNMEIVPDYEQPAWGKIGSPDPPLKRATLSAWRDISKEAVTREGEVILSRKWAMRHTDKKDCDEIAISGDWVEKLPKEPVFENRYQALYFDWHVASYVPDWMAKEEEKKNK